MGSDKRMEGGEVGYSVVGTKMHAATDNAWDCNSWTLQVDPV